RDVVVWMPMNTAAGLKARNSLPGQAHVLFRHAPIILAFHHPGKVTPGADKAVYCWAIRMWLEANDAPGDIGGAVSIGAGRRAGGAGRAGRGAGAGAPHRRVRQRPARLPRAPAVLYLSARAGPRDRRRDRRDWRERRRTTAGRR